MIVIPKITNWFRDPQVLKISQSSIPDHKDPLLYFFSLVSFFHQFFSRNVFKEATCATRIVHAMYSFLLLVFHWVFFEGGRGVNEAYTYHKFDKGRCCEINFRNQCESMTLNGGKSSTPKKQLCLSPARPTYSPVNAHARRTKNGRKN